MRLAFNKMEGLGNDFILIDDSERRIETRIAYSPLARRLCDRRYGVGADGLIISLPSDKYDIQFRIFNSDGSEAQMCGNGMRCFAKYLYENNIIRNSRIRVETLAGEIVPELHFDNNGGITSISVDMGEPVLEAARVPFISSAEIAIAETINTNLGSVSLTAVSMGNPHAVLFVEDVQNAPVETMGPLLKSDRRFPEKTNVEFVQVLSETEMRMRVWERGAGVTRACGTGACAAVVAAVLNGKTGRQVTVHLDGGPVRIEWVAETNHLIKTGPANMVFSGLIHL